MLLPVLAVAVVVMIVAAVIFILYRRRKTKKKGRGFRDPTRIAGFIVLGIGIGLLLFTAIEAFGLVGTSVTTGSNPLLAVVNLVIRGCYVGVMAAVAITVIRKGANLIGAK
jgi:heme/copper-type cytochrome/quinol oxidase subunit 2